MRLVELLLIEQHEVPGIAGIHAHAPENWAASSGHALVLFAHRPSLSVSGGKDK